MGDLTKEEYARLHLKAKHGMLTPEEQAIYFGYEEQRAEAARAAAAPPPAPEPTPAIVRAQPVQEEPKEPMGEKVRGFVSGILTPRQRDYQLRCPRCGGTNVAVQTVSEMKKRGCLSILLLVLLALTVVGLPLVIAWVILRGRKSVTKTYAVCQTCGNTWTVG